MASTEESRQRAAETKRHNTQVKIMEAVASMIQTTYFTMDMVADAAGVSEATLYRHYPSREEMLRSYYDYSGATDVLDRLYDLVVEMGQNSPELANKCLETTWEVLNREDLPAHEFRSAMLQAFDQVVRPGTVDD